MIIIVGCGLFGAIARDALAYHGHETYTIDDERPLSGSVAAGCLTKPSWLNSLGKKRDGALALLDDLYGLEKIPARIGSVKYNSLYHASPDFILDKPDLIGTVESIDPDAGILQLADGRFLFGDAILVAAGVWSAELLPEHFAGEQMRRIRGVSHTYKGETNPARIKVWAPYKQSIAFTIREGQTWFGDGTAILDKNWTLDHSSRAIRHAGEIGLKPQDYMKADHGLRPYVKGHKGWMRRAGARCWVSTGGAKNGMALAAKQAQEFIEQLTGERI